MAGVDAPQGKWMLPSEDRARRQPARTRWFVLLSLLLHGLAVVVLNLTWLSQDDAPPSPPRNPIRVSFAQPEKVEEPQQAEVFAQHSSRAQSPEGPQSEVARDTQSVLPKPMQTPSEPSPPAPVRPAQPPQPAVAPSPTQEVAKPPPSPPVEQPPPQARRPEPPRTEKPTARATQKPPVERPEPKRVAKLPEPPERPSPKPQLEVVPPSSPTAESPPEPSSNQPRFLGRIPLLSGDDLEKYAQVRASDQRSAAGETVSLDTKELKYLSYFAHIKRRIEGVWTYPPEAVAGGLQGQLHLKFVLQRNGQVKTVELLRSSGWKLLDKEAWDAVVNAGPFNSFPPMIPDDELHITARFTYALDETTRRARMR